MSLSSSLSDSFSLPAEKNSSSDMAPGTLLDFMLTTTLCIS
uniref:Ankyrin repeat domain-containing protein 13C-A-like n=1 Tax=Rhizophora mucronata TaxID=61149 RepID=A0A2P2NVH4_RHIMU